MSDNPGDIEDQIERAFETGDYDSAATLFIEHFGGDILEFLAGRLHDPPDVAEVFSIFAENFWKALPGFRWRTSMRSWAFVLARNAAYHYRNRPEKRMVHLTTISSKKSKFAQAVTKLRDVTKMHLCTEVKSQMRKIYDKLPDDDRSLLFLRIDKQLTWQDIAVIMSGQGEEMKEADRKQWANRLRQRFHMVKQRLKDLAHAEGLL